MNIWALPKELPIRLALLELERSHDLGSLSLDCTREINRQAVSLCDRQTPRLGAYLFTYGQSPERYGLELMYPTETAGSPPPYDALEELPLRRVIELLSMHFELD